jgi:acyl-CoA thioesterase-2
MSQVLNQLVALLTLKPSENLFRGVSQDLGFRQLFGGQVLGKCVSAASQTVNAEHRTLHARLYFLRPGDVSLPVVYQVEQVRGSGFNAAGDGDQKGKPILPAARPFSSLKRHSSPEPDA